MNNEHVIKTWDTDNEVAVAWGTHDAQVASAVYADEHLVPPFNTEDVPDFADGIKRWANPEVLILEEDEEWPAEAMSGVPVAGWVPFITVVQ